MLDPFGVEFYTGQYKWVYFLSSTYDCDVGCPVDILLLLVESCLSQRTGRKIARWEVQMKIQKREGRVEEGSCGDLVSVEKLIKWDLVRWR